MRKVIIGVMGVGEKATTDDLENAYQLGQMIAEEGWILLTGGRKAGVMNAASIGAKSVNGLTIGILPGKDKREVSEAVDIAIFTDMGNARNNINLLSSDVIIACGMGAGTASEITLALKSNKKVILLNQYEESQSFFKKLSPDNIYIVQNVLEVISQIKVFVLTT